MAVDEDADDGLPQPANERNADGTLKMVPARFIVLCHNFSKLDASAYRDFVGRTGLRSHVVRELAPLKKVRGRNTVAQNLMLQSVATIWMRWRDLPADHQNLEKRLFYYPPQWLTLPDTVPYEDEELEEDVDDRL